MHFLYGHSNFGERKLEIYLFLHKLIAIFTKILHTKAIKMLKSQLFWGLILIIIWYFNKIQNICLLEKLRGM